MDHEPETEAATEGVPTSLTLLFDGLFFMCFNSACDPAGECQVGFVTTAPDHVLSLKVKESVDIGAGMIEESEYLISLSTARARNIAQMELEVPGLTGNNVTRRGHKETINRRYPNDGNKDYFKWIIDLENGEMHNGEQTITREVLRPVLKIKTGEFYTERLSQEFDSVETAYKYMRVQGNTKKQYYGALATITGVKIKSLPEDKATLKVGDIIVPLVRRPNTTCEVCFSNRRSEAGHVHTPAPNEPAHPHPQHSSDFPYYYHAFSSVEPLRRFDFETAEPYRSVPPTICYCSSGCESRSIP